MARSIQNNSHSCRTAADLEIYSDYSGNKYLEDSILYCMRWKKNLMHVFNRKVENIG
jgi:hypothetical protein